MTRLARWAALAALSLTAACATVPTPSGPSTPDGPSTIPSAALELGDYQRATAASVMSGFERTINGRYGAGLQLSAVSADLRRNEFTCGNGSAGAGDPPDQICRRTETASGCTHTWQVHLYDESENDVSPEPARSTIAAAAMTACWAARAKARLIAAANLG